jgi:energy-coupling factor transporter transmembrane protein EcfT
MMQELTRDRIPRFLLGRSSSSSPKFEGRGLKTPLLEKGIRHVAEIIKTNFSQWESASKNGLFQKIDARIKILFLIFFLIIVSLKREIAPEVAIGIFVFLLALSSRLNLLRFYKKVFFLGFVFGFLIGLPSALNLVTKGEVVFPILSLSKPHDFWIYHIPEQIGLTKEGMYGVGMLTFRVLNSLSLTLLLLHTTPFSEVMKALKIIKIPDGLLVMMTLSYKYFFLFANTVEEMHLAKKSRLMRELGPGDARRWVAGRIAFIYGKTQKRSEDIFRAMLSRGFSDSIKIYGFRKLNVQDGGVAISLFLLGVLFLWI